MQLADIEARCRKDRFVRGADVQAVWWFATAMQVHYEPTLANAAMAMKIGFPINDQRTSFSDGEHDESS